MGAPKSRGAGVPIFQKMSHCDYRLKGGEFWLKQYLLQLVIIACTKFEKRDQKIEHAVAIFLKQESTI